MNLKSKELINVSEHEENYPEEAGVDKHLEDFTVEDRKMIQLMADIIVNAVLNS